MDLVPLDFCERVAAAWKCCEEKVSTFLNVSFRWKCVTPVFSTRLWAFSRNPNPTRFSVFTDARGEWRYNFRLESDIDLTMSELLEHPDFKNLRIDSIRINRNHAANRMNPVSDVGMEKLLNFVSFLANEPRVFIDNQNASNFSSPEGVILLSWLEQRWFSYIDFWTYHSAFNQLLQKQFSRRIPTKIYVGGVIEDKQFLADQLRSGQMTRFQAHCSMFSSDVMEGIVQSFLRSPEKMKIDIEACFDGSTEGHLMEMEKGGLCRRVDGKFIFENPFHRLEVSNSYYSVWKCVSVKSE